MILTRLMKAVREQNWFAVAIEFVIVILGVVIGFQVTQWAENRAEAERRAVAIDRLHDEVENAVGILAWLTDIYDTQNGHRTEAIERLISDDFDGMHEAEMTQAVVSLALLPAFSPRQGVYTEIVSSGMLSTIGDEALRDALGQYQSSVVFLQGQIDYFRTLSASERGMVSFDFVRLEYDPGSSRQRRHVIDWEAAAADPDFLQHVLGGNNRMRAIAEWWEDTLRDALALCAETARLSGRPCEPEAWEPQ